MKRLILNAAFGLFLATLPTAGFANDEALYGAPVPQDAVFIRWLGDIAPSSLSVFKYDFSALDIENDAYSAISNAALTGATPGGYYSVATDTNGQTHLIQEPARNDKSKVHLLLVHADAAAGPVQMVLAGTERVVIGETVHGQANARAVNPVAVRMTLAGDVDQSEFDLTLRRGQNMTVAVIAGNVTVIENRFGPVIVTE